MSTEVGSSPLDQRSPEQRESRPRRGADHGAPRGDSIFKAAPGAPLTGPLRDLSRRIKYVREETFDLVERLQEPYGRACPELELAASKMQSVANDLGTIEALIATAGRSNAPR